MVMFRAHTLAAAKRLKLTGYVFNLSDGAVRAVAEGKHEQLEVFLKALQRGSWLSKVDAVESTFMPATGEFSSFSIRYE